MPLDNTIRTRTSVYTVLESGIIEQSVRAGATQSITDAQANCVAFIKLASPHGATCLVDLRYAGPAQPGVNDVYASPMLARHVHALALLIDSGLSQVMGNFYLAITHPPMPTRMFRGREEALTWLREHVRRAQPA